MIERFVGSNTYHLPENEVRELCKQYNRGRVFVYYGDNTYKHSVKHILDLCNAIIEDYPAMEYKDMEVRTINTSQSNRHAHITMIGVNIPVDDYIRMRNENTIHVL